MDVDVLVLNVSESPVPWFPGVGSAHLGPYAWRRVAVGAPGEDMDALMDDARARAAAVASGSEIDDGTTIAEVGDPVEVIRSVAVAEDVDIIVVGASDKGWWRRLIDGSVSGELVRSAERPVLVVR
jgi:nucleotide-binding universal stress UspA family protein